MSETSELLRDSDSELDICVFVEVRGGAGGGGGAGGWAGELEMGVMRWVVEMEVVQAGLLSWIEQFVSVEWLYRLLTRSGITHSPLGVPHCASF